MTRDSRKTVAEMLGEFFREAAVLVLVFGFLEKFAKGETPSVLWTGGVIVVSWYAFSLGVRIERTRKG